MDLIGVPFFLSEHSEHSEYSEALNSNFLLNRLNLCEPLEQTGGEHL